ncbi:fimbrial protein [Citrobacter braakii]|uniref:fimbrial protein n=1 Tax=Citrobacter braakii TaxID=57706 RepID=UPI0034E4BF2E
MKKLISAMLLCAPLSALAADATVDLTFKGTLTSPTCTTSFTGSDGVNIAFGSLNASDIVGKVQGTIIPAAPVKNVSLKFSGCNSISNIKVNFVGASTSGAGFIRKAVNFLDTSKRESGLGFALFKNTASTSIDDAVYVSADKEGEPNVLTLATLTKTGNDYTWPLYAKMVVTLNSLLKDSAAVNTNSAGKDLSATAYANIVYE